MIDTNVIGALGYAVAMVAFVFLTILLSTSWRRADQTRLPAFATAASAVWAGVWIASFLGMIRAPLVITFMEFARGLAWLLASRVILSELAKVSFSYRLLSRYGLFVLLVTVLPVAYFLFRSVDINSEIAWVAGGFVVSVFVVVMVEQLFRHAVIDARGDVTYIGIGIAGMFLTDFATYSLVMADIQLGVEYWASRGFVNALFAAPLAFGMWRRSGMTPATQVPPQIAFYSFGMAIIAIYLVVVFVGYHYVQTYAGSWREVAGIVLVVGAIIIVVIILASARSRARLRVFLMKTFVHYKYDYRKEWLRFISTLSTSGLDNVSATAVRAVAQIVNSPGGVVWIQEQESNAYLPAGTWHCILPRVSPVDEVSPIVTFLKKRQWIIDLQEMKRFPERYEGLHLASWLTEANWWLVVPLFLGKRLFGFILLQRPRSVPSLNFEDHDLLRTVGSHVAMHINQAETDRRLTEIRQFSAYDRLTAFLMHDLNNVIAQQSLVVKNAERFRNNPRFVDDAIDTIAHSVSRMKRLMEQLSSGSKVPQKCPTDVREALTKAVDRCKVLQPEPEVRLGRTPMWIEADLERLVTVFEHLIKNAQDATDSSGQVILEGTVEKGVISVSISDSGAGMTPEFIRDRLFRPFDSTKGSESMGIGAYQARDYVRSLGGQIEVSSEPGVGTTFTVRFAANS